MALFKILPCAGPPPYGLSKDSWSHACEETGAVQTFGVRSIAIITFDSKKYFHDDWSDGTDLNILAAGIATSFSSTSPISRTLQTCVGTNFPIDEEFSYFSFN